MPPCVGVVHFHSDKSLAVTRWWKIPKPNLFSLSLSPSCFSYQSWLLTRLTFNGGIYHRSISLSRFFEREINIRNVFRSSFIPEGGAFCSMSAMNFNERINDAYSNPSIGSGLPMESIFLSNVKIRDKYGDVISQSSYQLSLCSPTQFCFDFFYYCYR